VECLSTTVPASSGGFGAGNFVVEFEQVKNIGWEKHLNEVGSAFFTVNQEDPKLSGLRPYKGTAHVVITRDEEVVWRGVWGEHDATGQDVIFYCYGYEGFLYSLQTDWNQQWEDKTIAEIVTDLWTYAKTTLTYSPLGFVTTGTIQAPVTTSGGSTAIELPLYRTYIKRILFSLKELAALGTSDTTNTVYFEITHPTDPTDLSATFNFWKNKSTDRTDLMLEYANGSVRDFVDGSVPVTTRNDLSLLGSAPNDLLLRQNVSEATGDTGYELFGRRQEPLYFAWVRDDTELDRVGKIRLARAIRAEPDIRLMLYANSVVPPGVSTSEFALGDRVRVKLQRGITQVDQMMFVSGVQVLSIRGQEHVMPWLQDRSGS
jgi:hypothetical protein